MQLAGVPQGFTVPAEELVTMDFSDLTSAHNAALADGHGTRRNLGYIRRRLLA
jgi:hypothetical protein